MFCACVEEERHEIIFCEKRHHHQQKVSRVKLKYICWLIYCFIGHYTVINDDASLQCISNILVKTIKRFTSVADRPQTVILDFYD